MGPQQSLLETNTNGLRFTVHEGDSNRIPFTLPLIPLFTDPQCTMINEQWELWDPMGARGSLGGGELDSVGLALCIF